MIRILFVNQKQYKYVANLKSSFLKGSYIMASRYLFSLRSLCSIPCSIQYADVADS
jgi:hypothetical protein